jgi:hypothetical protein
MPRYAKNSKTLVLAALLAATLFSCAHKDESVAVSREQLFTLGYGKAEDQLDLFQAKAQAAPLKTCFSMREGIFYVANGNSAKLVRYSSFGDVLSMIYNPERNPEPLLLKTQSGKEASGRSAIQYPFRAVGEVAVDSRQNIYIEDRLPPERRVYDKELDSNLDYVVLRFDKDGQAQDYLGLEGLGGTPFPYISAIYVTPADDCIVVSLTQSFYLVNWFDSRGFVKRSLRMRRDSLPQPQNGKNLIASLDRIAPDSDGKALVVKIDYYKNSVDPSTKSEAGVEFAGSWAYHMDPATGTISDRWEIPALDRVVKNSDGSSQHEIRIPEFLGMADHRLFFLSAADGDKSEVSVFDTVTHVTSRYSIDISQDELYFSSLYLSPDGILCALLGTKYEARIVWWRFDKLLGGSRKDSGS